MEPSRPDLLDWDSPPSTPAQSARSTRHHRADNLPSTTPAGPPPSSVASYTPAGAPSVSYLGSSLVQDPTAGHGPDFSTTSSRILFPGAGPGGRDGWPAGSPLDRPPIRLAGGGAIARKAPAGLSRPYHMGQKTPALPGVGSSFEMAGDDGEAEEDEEEEEEEDEFDDEEEEEEEEEEDAEAEDDDDGDYEEEEADGQGDEIGGAYADYYQDGDEDAEGEAEENIETTMDRILDHEMAARAEAEGRLDDDDNDDDEDLFLNMGDGTTHQPSAAADQSDLIDLDPPATASHIRREAEDIYRATARLSIHAARPEAEFRCGAFARDICRQLGVAQIQEPAQLILRTDDLLSRLYQQGVGTEDDAKKLDDSLAQVAIGLAAVWDERVQSLKEQEEALLRQQPRRWKFLPQYVIGPGRDGDPFAKAAFVAHLVLRIHHSRFEDPGFRTRLPPLPEVLFSWQKAHHNPYPDQTRELMTYPGSPTCHGLFWQGLRETLLRGEVRAAHDLLEAAGWEHAIRPGPTGIGEPAYLGRALDNVRRAGAATCQMLQMCPGFDGDWDIWSDRWATFRALAEGALRSLRQFAEGAAVDRQQPQQQQDLLSTVAGLTRKAESQLPWDVYENLQTVYDIVLGIQPAILETAQDWLEATIGLMGWWDQGRLRQHKNLRMSTSASTNARVPSLVGSRDSYAERLSLAMGAVLDAEFQMDTSSDVEIAVASAVEGNMAAVIGLLRAWSLPVASAVAEVASLGQWLPRPQGPNPLVAILGGTAAVAGGGEDDGGLDADDLAVLGLTPQDLDETDGVKDATLIRYARELAGADLSDSMDGWELAIQVLGRMDSAERAEETIGELLGDLMAEFEPDSGPTVEKIWRILRDLSLVNFADEVAESYAEILSRLTHRYGEALWYYSLAHRPAKVRDVLNLLMSYCLVQSTAYPAAEDLDPHLRRLLAERGDALEECARQDVDAAELLGRALSGYATLRRFYDLRDGISWAAASPARWLARRRQAATALVAVVASADDSIRGGLHDPGRDSVVSEDFLLALLGEATVFVPARDAGGRDGGGGRPRNQSQHHHHHHTTPVLTLDQVDTLLKAVEDLQTVGPRVYSACVEFLRSATASAPGDAKGSRPSDLMTNSNSLSSSMISGLGGSSYVLTSGSMLASRAHADLAAAGGAKSKRGWDWRTDTTAGPDGGELLKRLRVGLARELALLWIDEADNGGTTGR